MKRYRVVANCYGMELEDHTCETKVAPDGEFVKVSELRELLAKQMAEDYCGKMSNTEVQHREKFRGELLAELSDKEKGERK